jgi:hypothetical protein
MSKQELKCIQEINNFINEYKKIIKKDTEIYLHTTHYGIFDKTLYPNERKYIELTSNTINKEFKECPLTENINIYRKIIPNLDKDFIYKKDKVKYNDNHTFGSLYTLYGGYYPYYQTTLSPLSPKFFDKLFKNDK